MARTTQVPFSAVRARRVQVLFKRRPWISTRASRVNHTTRVIKSTPSSTKFHEPEHAHIPVLTLTGQESISKPLVTLASSPRLS